MSIIKRMRKQRCTWWQRNGVDDYGKPTYLEPVELACRWDDVNQEFIGPHGTKQTSKSIVYPERIMIPGDVLREGIIDLDELGLPDDTDLTDIKLFPGASEILRFDKTPNLRAIEYLYTAYL